MLQVDAGGSKSFGDAGFRELRELRERVDAPAFQDLPHFLFMGRLAMLSC